MDYYFLIAAAFITSTISGIIGMAGGILLLTIMAQFFEPILLIPLHGVVQLASNSSRCYFYAPHIEWKRTRLFAVGAIIGAGLVALIPQAIVSLPEGTYKLILAGFILSMTWLPKPKKFPKIKWKFAWLGGVATFLSLFVGATGPLLAPFFLRENLKKEVMVATKASCQSIVHFFKILVFLYIGVHFWEHWPLLISMIVAVSLGSWLGRQLIGLLPEKLFMRLFQWTITFLALRMIYLSLI